jgi:hypothetical protein
LSWNIQNDDHAHNRQRQQHPHIFTFHNFFHFVVCVQSPPTGFGVWTFGSQTTGRTDPLLWGVTLPQFEARLSRDWSNWLSRWLAVGVFIWFDLV